MTGRITFVFRDEDGNTYRGSSIGRALEKLPEEARAAATGPRDLSSLNAPAPTTAAELWNTENEYEPNLERVYRT